MCMEYRLLDSGEGKKLERFGSVTLVRPSCTAIWPRSDQSLWTQACAEYRRVGEEGQWYTRRSVPQEWQVTIEGVICTLKLTPFGHVGLFPEHTTFWPDLKQAIDQHTECRVLNLFAYTGSTSIFSAQCNARVCHVDASKAAVKWAQNNVLLNALPEKRIFWVIEDVFSFLEREIRRGKQYDVIILDPPTYGRGVKGEVFKIDRDFFRLLTLCSQLLSDRCSYVLITSHTPGHTPAFLQSLVFRAMSIDKHRWRVGESFCGQGDLALPSGVFALWS